MEQQEPQVLTSAEFWQHAFDTATESLTEAQRIEVKIWSGGRMPKDFWDTVSREAYDCIMELISNGFG